MMDITRVSPISGEEHTLRLPVSQIQMARWEMGEYVQDVFPHLSASQREFIISGITEEEWEDAFGLSEEEWSEEEYD
jgi:hypothetical protein